MCSLLSFLLSAFCFQLSLAPLRPDIVVIQMGVNDLTGLHPRSREVDRVVAATRDAIAAVVGSARNLGAYVIVTTIFPLARGYVPDQAVQAAISAVNAELPALSGQSVQLFDSAAVLMGPDGYVRSAYADDELHLSPERATRRLTRRLYLYWMRRCE